MSLLIALLLSGATVYEREITISNPAETLYTEVQIPLDLDAYSLVSAGKLDKEQSALRFFRKDYPLNYWIDDSTALCSTRVWLKLDTLLQGEQKITMLYSDSTDGYKSPFDSVFTKAQIDSSRGWVFHCDEGAGDTGFSADNAERIILQNVAWDRADGGVWGKRQDKGFASGSALDFTQGSYASWDMPSEICQDSFTFMLWLRLDTLDELAYSNPKRVILEKPGVFSLWLRNGTIGFSPQGVSRSTTLYLPPFGWERVGEPAIPSAYIPQGLTTIGDKLLLSAYRNNPLSSRVWLIDPCTLEIMEWFDMPLEATHTSGLAYDSTRGVVWAADYDSGVIYEIDLVKSFFDHQAALRGQFSMEEEGVSSCCLAPIKDKFRLIVSIYKKSDAQTYVLDGPASIERGRALILSSYRNVGYSQGLAFDGQYLWESGLMLAQFDLDKAVDKGDYKAGIVSYWAEPPQEEGITFLRDTLWGINEYWGRDFFKLTEDPEEYLGRWIHIAVSYDGSTLSLYRNGELADSFRVGSYTKPWEASPLYIGGLDEGKSSFQGSLDEIVFVKGALKPDQIMAYCERRNPLDTQPFISIATEEDASSGDEAVSRFMDSLGIETSSSVIELKIPYEREIEVSLFDISGRKAATLLEPQRVRGRLELPWPKGVSSGIYFVMVRCERDHATRKVVILR